MKSGDPVFWVDETGAEWHVREGVLGEPPQGDAPGVETVLVGEGYYRVHRDNLHPTREQAEATIPDGGATAPAETLVRDLGSEPPPAGHWSHDDACALCGAEGNDPADHSPACAWRRAAEWTAAHPAKEKA